jgi:tRNA-specific 2-thiouridylase
MSASINKKVFVGLSGGVDSSISATLLKEQGYDVTGVFIKTWHPEFLECTWKDDRRDAMHISAELGIPFVMLDLEAEYKREVADYMIREYQAGRTPNPDVMCNQHVKFGAFLEWARKQGADYVATGHYARTAKEGGAYNLLAGIDTNKDQSYFLWTLRQDQLAQIIFPIGEMEKPHVRELAKEYGLITANKKDSQGVCFLGPVDMKEFLKRYIDTKPGDVLDPKGNVIGQHDGALLYTIGQRHGFTITKKGIDSPRLFVIHKDLTQNTITVGSQEVQTKESIKEVKLGNINWINKNPESEKSYGARIRYRQPLQTVKIATADDETIVTFGTPQTGVATGQSLVMYEDDVCIGGGTIEAVSG